jgi:hypothetical protein
MCDIDPKCLFEGIIVLLYPSHSSRERCHGRLHVVGCQGNTYKWVCYELATNWWSKDNIIKGWLGFGWVGEPVSVDSTQDINNTGIDKLYKGGEILEESYSLSPPLPSLPFTQYSIVYSRDTCRH